MKREIEREKELPAFLLEVDDLYALWKKAAELFDGDEFNGGSIDVKLKKENLSFDNLQELKDYTELSGDLIDFKIYFSNSDFGNNRKTIWIRSPYFRGARPEVSVQSNSEAWCAGAAETIYSFFNSYKRSYNWFLSKYIGWFLNLIFIVCAVVTTAAFEAAQKPNLFESSVLYSLIAASASIGLLFLARRSLFPSAVIRLTKKENYLKKNAAQISLIVAITSIVVSIIGLVLGK